MLKQMGHAIGWHPHYYKEEAGSWKQNTDEESILHELEYLMPYVNKYQLDIVRVGWGYHTNKTMRFFDQNGFKIDSSCMARPKYKWDLSVKDWEISTNKPYYPSFDDYRIPASEHLSILEVPMTTVLMPVSTDTEVVKRYVNPAFFHDILKEPLHEWIMTDQYLVTITHPYEVDASGNHNVIAFDFEEFIKNIEYVERVAKQKYGTVKYFTLDHFLKGE
jgi:hypothetical protein